MASSVTSKAASAVASGLKKKVFVVGVGMTKFEKPGRRDDFDYPQMALEAVGKALKDARVDYKSVQQAAVGYVYGDSTCGQRALYQCGMTGIPIFNVNNNCSTGSSALMMAKQLIEGGVCDCALALGFEKMQKGSLTSQFDDRTNPLDKHVEVLAEVSGLQAEPVAAQMFGGAGIEHMDKYGTKPEHFAKIAEKNHRHSAKNPLSQFRDVYTLDQIMGAPKVSGVLTKLQCCPTSDGAAAAVLASESFVESHGLGDRAVEVLGMEMATDLPSSFEEKSAIKMVGFDMTKSAADRLYKSTGVDPTSVDVVELHDCFSTNELISYEALGLCGEGEGGAMVDAGDNTYGGRVVVNPSGGLISKGHPLGATGLAQCTELCQQLRGECGERQVEGASLALQHNIGLGGAAVVALYRKKGAKKSGTRNHSSMVNNSEASGFKSAIIFDAIASALEADGKNLVNKVKGIYAFKVKRADGKEGLWIVDAKNGAGSVEFGGKAKPNVTLTLKDGDLVDLMTGKLNAQKAFFQGKLKIQGNMGLALKLQEFQKQAGDVMKSKL